jgi:iron-sulfur cluster assembly accessory protein
MARYSCTVCGYIYDEELGDPEGGLQPGTLWTGLPDDWLCPVCGAARLTFEQWEQPKRERKPRPVLAPEDMVVSRQMNVQEVATKYPEAVQVMLGYGLHCVGCHASMVDTIEDGARGHGMADEEIDDLVAEINAAIRQEKDRRAALPKDAGAFTLSVTEFASSKFKEFMAQEKDAKGVRLKVVPGGCAGYMYDLFFDTKTNPDDTVVTQGGIQVFIDPESARHVSGSEIDYIETLKESGFKVKNPNAKSSCGCGNSFG